MQGLLDFLQGASNSAASNVSAPVDGVAWLLRKAGLPIPANPIGGSDWMAEKGLTAQPKNKNMGLLGEAIGGVAPIVAAAKAPQIAKGLLQMEANAMAPARLGKQTGGLLIDSKSTPMNKFSPEDARKSIKDYIAADDEYSDFGLRVLPDSQNASIGGKLDKSYRWIDGNSTGEQLNGTSTIGVNSKNIDRALRDLLNNGYQGNRIALVKGVRTGSGEDLGEDIINDAQILQIWAKD